MLICILYMFMIDRYNLHLNNKMGLHRSRAAPPSDNGS